MDEYNLVNFYFLMTILLCGIFMVFVIFWAVIRYIKKRVDFKTGSSVILTKGKVIKKFYSGGDPRIDGSPTMKLKFTHDDIEHEIDKEVEQEIFFEYDEGEDIELFISNIDELKVYPLKSLKGKNSGVEHCRAADV